MVLDIADSSAVKSRNEGTLFRLLTRDEVTAFAQDRELELDASMALRLDSGIDFCFGALVDGELVGYYWLALNSIEPSHNRLGTEASGVALSFPTDAIFSYNAFVHPSLRGRGHV